MPNQPRSYLKTIVRRLTRHAGYELVPLTGSLGSLRTSILKDVDLVVDVGANVGQYAERVRDLGFSGNILSFEPSTEAFRLLSRRAARGPAWEARNLALGEEAGTASLNLAANSVSSSLLPMAELHLAAAPTSRFVAAEQVKVSTLDLEVHPQGSTFLKLDVQGSELAVLRGGTAVLRQVAAIQVEVSFDLLYKGQSEWTEIVRMLEARGFTLRYIEPGYEDPDTGWMLQADFLFVKLRHDVRHAATDTAIRPV